ncbi:MAG: ABC transporter permease [Acidobacteriota bacterium]
MNEISQENWLYEISPKKKLIELNFKEIWRYRDLLLLFVKRDIVTVYKQTILGPLWFLIQPLLTSVIFTLVFNGVAGINVPGVPMFLFNLAGITLWNYFSDCITNTADTFTKNQDLFGKVYFPRIIMPLSVVISNLVKFGIQLLIFIVFYLIYIGKGIEARPNIDLFFFPLLLITMAMLGLGIGTIISSLTTKYRDLKFLVTFGVQLLMYLSAVPYPLSELVNSSKLQAYPWAIFLIKYNPLTQIIEGFRYMTLGKGMFNTFNLSISFLVALSIFLIGLIIFNKTEKSFIDTV